ncbi:MAG: hypothetical protein ABIE42_05820 [Candidatus Eisenbacteria bacterium]
METIRLKREFPICKHICKHETTTRTVDVPVYRCSVCKVEHVVEESEITRTGGGMQWNPPKEWGNLSRNNQRSAVLCPDCWPKVVNVKLLPRAVR